MASLGAGNAVRQATWNGGSVIVIGRGRCASEAYEKGTGLIPDERQMVLPLGLPTTQKED